MSYSAAIAPPAVYVLGKRLEPLSLGHAHLLDLVESPFIRGGSPGAGDLVLAVEICRVPWQESRRMLQLPGLDRRIEKLGKALCRRRVGYEADDVSEFVTYMTEAANGPGFWVKQQETKAGGSPWLQSIKTTLMRAGRTYAEAMDTPLREALWDFAAYWEQEGALDIQSDAERAMIEAAKHAG